MTIFQSLLSGLAVCAIASCTDNGDPTNNDVGQTIDYELSVYDIGIHPSIHIDPDGQAVWTKADGSVTEFQLDADALADLHRKVEDAMFNTLEPIYGCGGCADDAVHEVTVQEHGLSYAVQADTRAAYPERLRPVLETLKSLVVENTP